MAQPYDYTIKAPTPAESFIGGYDVGTKFKARRVDTEAKREELSILQDKTRSLKMYENVNQFAHLPYEQRQEALSQFVAEQEAQGNDMTHSRKFLSMGAEEQALAHTGMKQNFEARGWLKPQAVAKVGKLTQMIDSTTGQEVSVSNADVAANPNRFKKIKSRARVAPTPMVNLQTNQIEMVSADAATDTANYRMATKDEIKYNVVNPTRGQAQPQVAAPTATVKEQNFERVATEIKVGRPTPIRTTGQGKMRDKEGEALGAQAEKRQQKLVNAINGVAETGAMINMMAEYRETHSQGTGPFATAGGLLTYFDDDTEKLDAFMNKLSFKEIITFISAVGSSKIMDSDAERKFFKTTQAGITKDDLSNTSIIVGQLSLGTKSAKYQDMQKQYIDTHGTLSGFSGTNILKSTALYNPNEPIGTPPVLINKAHSKKYAKDNGLMNNEQYIKYLGSNNGRPTAQTGITKSVNWSDM